MSKKNPFKRITLETLPNGYALTVDLDKYMYFSVEDLLTGFFTHVGLKMGNPLDKELMRDLMTACATWPREGDAIQAAAKQERTIEAMRQIRDRDAKTICEQYERIGSLTEKVKDLTKKIAWYQEEKMKATPKTEPKTEPKADVKKPAKASSIVTRGDVVETKKNGRTSIKPEVEIPYSDEVYNALMLPLTMDKTGFPSRVLSILKMVGGSKNATIGDALKHSKKEFKKIRGFGPATDEVIQKFLNRHHLDYAMNVEAIIMQHEMQKNQNIK